MVQSVFVSSDSIDYQQELKLLYGDKIVMTPGMECGSLLVPTSMELIFETSRETSAVRVC